MVIWLVILAGIVVVLMLAGRARVRADSKGPAEALTRKASYRAGRADLDALSGIPAPVIRYFRQVLESRQGLVRTATFSQSGVLRTGTTSGKWYPFTATQLVVPAAPGFVWNARVGMPLGMHLRVIDSYVAGAGAGRISLLSAIPMASDTGKPPLNAAALHRYLAEAVWVPTALLPQAGIAWTPIDDGSARASLRNGDTSVSLVFRFNDAGEVSSIYTPARFARVGGRYRPMPWEGRFYDYVPRAGMRVPSRGEVGWYVDGRLQIVWRGEIVDAHYEIEQRSDESLQNS